MKTKQNRLSLTDEEAELAWPEIPLPVDESEYPWLNGNANFNPNRVKDSYWLEMQKTQWSQLQSQKRLPARPELPLEPTLESAFKSVKIRQYEHLVPEKDRPDNYQKKIRQYFVNRKRDIVHDSSSSQTPVPLFMLASAEGGPEAASAFSLFEQSVKDAVNEETNQWRQMNGLDHTHHVGIYKNLLSRKWASLSEEERSRYLAEATVIKKQQSASDNIYKNQIQTSDFIKATMLRAIGHGAGQIGNTSFYLLMAYRNEKDEIQTQVHFSGANFTDYLGAQAQGQLEQQWADFVGRNVHRNKLTLAKQQFKQNDTGRFLLASSEDFSQSQRGPAAYLQFLRDFLCVSWEHDVPGAQPMSWESLIQRPKMYLRPEVHRNQFLADIESRHSRLYTFAEYIIGFQSEYPTDSIFNFLTSSDCEDSMFPLDPLLCPSSLSPFPSDPAAELSVSSMTPNDSWGPLSVFQSTPALTISPMASMTSFPSPVQAMPTVSRSVLQTSSVSAPALSNSPMPSFPSPAQTIPYSASQTSSASTLASPTPSFPSPAQTIPYSASQTSSASTLAQAMPTVSRSVLQTSSVSAPALSNSPTPSFLSPVQTIPYSALQTSSASTLASPTPSFPSSAQTMPYSASQTSSASTLAQAMPTVSRSVLQTSSVSAPALSNSPTPSFLSPAQTIPYSASQTSSASTLASTLFPMSSFPQTMSHFVPQTPPASAPLSAFPPVISTPSHETPSPGSQTSPVLPSFLDIPSTTQSSSDLTSGDFERPFPSMLHVDASPDAELIESTSEQDSEQSSSSASLRIKIPPLSQKSVIDASIDNVVDHPTSSVCTDADEDEVSTTTRRGQKRKLDEVTSELSKMPADGKRLKGVNDSVNQADGDVGEDLEIVGTVNEGHRVSSRIRKAKDPNADNKHTGSPAHKRR
ncbi:hypothetical protein VKT23_014158 [Stygiomarasmius scandens]|uniref:HMG box domain-containing protein n=1 Tax=Marasmiellus scandens TaxID=2682957 RepID=A0ABR1J4Z8_9AGAR